jgi:hypothetical protein
MLMSNRHYACGKGLSYTPLRLFEPLSSRDRQCLILEPASDWTGYFGVSTFANEEHLGNFYVDLGKPHNFADTYIAKYMGNDNCY